MGAGSTDGVGVWVGVGEVALVDVGVGVSVSVGVLVGMSVGVSVGIGVDVGVSAGVLVGVDVGVPVAVGVNVGAGVTVAVCVGKGVGVTVGSGSSFQTNDHSLLSLRTIGLPFSSVRTTATCHRYSPNPCGGSFNGKPGSVVMAMGECGFDFPEGHIRSSNVSCACKDPSHCHKNSVTCSPTMVAPCVGLVRVGAGQVGGVVGVGEGGLLQDDMENDSISIMTRAVTAKHVRELLGPFILFVIPPGLLTSSPNTVLIYCTSNDHAWLTPLSSPKRETMATCHLYVPLFVNLEARTG